MDIATILALASGVEQLVKALEPEVEKLLASGKLSTEEQAKLKASIDGIRDGTAFDSDIWNQKPT